MKRMLSDDVEEERLAIEISNTVKKRDEQGNFVYTQVLTNPAFLMLQAPDAVFEILKQRPLALLNLIRTHPTMSEFWSQFPSIWLILLNQVINKIYGKQIADLYPLIATLYQETLKELPFIIGGWSNTLAFSYNRTDRVGRAYFNIDEKAAIAAIFSRWPLLRYPVDKEPGQAVEKGAPIFLIEYVEVSRRYVKFLYLTRRVLSILFIHLSSTRQMSDLYRTSYTSFYAQTKQIYQNLLHWWEKGSASHTSEMAQRGELTIFYASAALHFGLTTTTTTSDVIEHKYNSVLLMVVDEIIRVLARFELGPLQPGFVDLYDAERSRESALIGKLPLKQAEIFNQFRVFGQALIDYLQQADNLNEQPSDTLIPLDANLLQDYRKRAFGPSSFYNTAKEQRILLLAEIAAIEKSMRREELITQLGSHYARGLTHCGSCANQSVTQADTLLSLAFCNTQCRSTYYATHQVNTECFSCPLSVTGEEGDEER